MYSFCNPDGLGYQYQLVWIVYLLHKTCKTQDDSFLNQLELYQLELYLLVYLHQIELKQLQA